MYVYRQNGDHFDRVPVHVKYRDRDSVVVTNDGAIFPGDRYIGDSSGAVYCLRCGITIAATSAEGVLR